MPLSVRSACVKAVTLSGTSWSRSLRRVAVTTMSAGLVAESVLFAVAASAGRFSTAGVDTGWAAAGADPTGKSTHHDVTTKRLILPPWRVAVFETPSLHRM